MAAPGLDIQHVTKRLGKSLVLDRISLEVADGELMVLLGASGSGKSTLLRVIAGLIGHDSGSIAIGGRDVGTLPASRRNAAMVFQSYALFPHMTILDNLTFGARARGEASADIAARVSTVTAALDIERFLARYPRQLSGGERQRVALGRAMLRDPAVFLMDEPLSNLDAQLRVQTRAEIVRLQARLRTTTVYVTHDQVEALSMGDRIGVLNQGRIEQLGTPTEIYHQPASLFVARFIGTPAMNTMEVVAAAPDRVIWKDRLVAMPARYRDTLGSAGRSLILGIRPEHIFLEGSRWAMGAPPAETLPAVVSFVELAGDQVYVGLTVNDQLIVARAEPEFGAKPGDRMAAWFHTDAVHLFDRATEAALTQRMVA